MKKKKQGDFLKQYRYCAKQVSLSLYDTGKCDAYGKTNIGYRLTVKGKVIFQSKDFHCAPGIAIDSRECADSLMHFLTLRERDVEEEYFDEYTPTQLEWSESSLCEECILEINDREEARDKKRKGRAW
jgi:hypothetical protein